MIDLMRKILPIKGWCFERNKFDPFKMMHPGCTTEDHAYGPLHGCKDIYDFLNKEQGGKCYFCDNPIAHKHHVIEQSRGGADCPANYIGLCEQCHAKVHTKTMEAKIAKVGKYKTYDSVSVINQAWAHIVEYAINVFGEENVYFCGGWETKEVREQHNLPKDHDIDAVCIYAASRNIMPTNHAKKREFERFRRNNRAVINSQRERTYFVDGKPVAKNRKPRFQQPEKELALSQWLEQFPEDERKSIVSKFKKYRSGKKELQYCVKPSARHYNTVDRILPGAVFYYQGKRYVLSGQSKTQGRLTAAGHADEWFPISKCTIYPAGGLMEIT